MVGLTAAQIKKAPSSVLALPATHNVEELAKWYSTADVFVNCTYEETLSMVNLEAQACGCPVVTYWAGGTVETAHAGYVVEKGNVESVVKLLPTAIAEKHLADISVFEKKRAIARYLEVYQGKV